MADLEQRLDFPVLFFPSLPDCRIIRSARKGPPLRRKGNSFSGIRRTEVSHGNDLSWLSSDFSCNVNSLACQKNSYNPIVIIIFASALSREMFPSIRSFLKKIIDLPYFFWYLFIFSFDKEVFLHGVYPQGEMVGSFSQIMVPSVGSGPQILNSR